MFNLFDHIDPYKIVATNRTSDTLKRQAKQRAAVNVFNQLNNVSVQMTPEQGSNANQMRDMYYDAQRS